MVEMRKYRAFVIGLTESIGIVTDRISVAKLGLRRRWFAMVDGGAMYEEVLNLTKDEVEQMCRWEVAVGQRLADLNGATIQGRGLAWSG